MYEKYSVNWEHAPGIRPMSPASPALPVDFSPTEPLKKPKHIQISVKQLSTRLELALGVHQNKRFWFCLLWGGKKSWDPLLSTD